MLPGVRLRGAGHARQDPARRQEGVSRAGKFTLFRAVFAEVLRRIAETAISSSKMANKCRGDSRRRRRIRAKAAQKNTRILDTNVILYYIYVISCCSYLYIYIYRERERDTYILIYRYTYIFIHIYIYIYIHIYIYIYIYIWLAKLP